MLSILHSIGIELNVYGPSLSIAIDRVTKICLNILNTIQKHPVALAFTIPFLTRLVPELRCWPYPIGWDTVEHIAHLRDFTLSPNPFAPHVRLEGPRNLPPLLDIVLGYPSLIIDPWWNMKIWPAIEVGLVGALASFIARKILRLSPAIFILVGITALLHIVTIVSSVQWHRHVIGLAMLLLAVVILELYYRTRPALASIVLILASLSYEPIAFLIAALSLYALSRLGSSDRIARLLYLIAFMVCTYMFTKYLYSPVSRSFTYKNPYVDTTVRGTYISMGYCYKRCTCMDSGIHSTASYRLHNAKELCLLQVYGTHHLCVMHSSSTIPLLYISRNA